jgi:hypothetical protein
MNRFHCGRMGNPRAATSDRSISRGAPAGSAATPFARMSSGIHDELTWNDHDCQKCVSGCASIGLPKHWQNHFDQSRRVTQKDTPPR